MNCSAGEELKNCQLVKQCKYNKNTHQSIYTYIHKYTHIYTNARCPQWRLCLTLADIKAEMLNMPEGVGEV